MYGYGFQGQESDDEVKGKGNSVNYKYRMHDPRIGRFFAIDPLADKYPHYTPYQFSGNKVIHAVELEGLEEDLLDYNDYIVYKPVSGAATTFEAVDNWCFNAMAAVVNNTWHAGANSISGSVNYFSSSVQQGKTGTEMMHDLINFFDEYRQTLENDAERFLENPWQELYNTFTNPDTYAQIFTTILTAKVSTPRVKTSVRVPAAASGTISRTLNGSWVGKTRNFNSKTAADFQSSVTGKKHKWTGKGQVYEIPEYDYNGVSFDGYSDGILYEAKSGYGNFVNPKTGSFHDWFKGKDALVKEARGQLNAADGNKVKWVFDNQNTMKAVQDLFEDQGINGIDYQYIELNKN